MECKIEWRIENFSCWVEDVHGAFISCPRTSSFPEFRAWFYPVEDGRGEDMRVSCHLGQLLGRRGGHLDFFGSDRSSRIRTEAIPVSKDENARLDLPGPNFKAVIEQIRMEEGDYGDHLTLLFRFTLPLLEGSSTPVLSLCTTLHVLSDLTVRFSTRRLLQECNDAVLLTCVRQEGEEEQEAHLEVHISERKKLYFRLLPATPWAMSGLAVLSHLWLLDQQGSPAGRDCERRQHTFYKMNPHCKEYFSLTSGLQDKDMDVEGRMLMIRLQFVSGRMKHSREGGGWALESPDAGRISPAPAVIERAATTSALKDELGALYRDREFSDFRLRCAGTTFDVHRAILAARSPVFRRRFRSSKSSMDVVDIDPTTLEQFLCFLYSGALGAPPLDVVLNLYDAADRFEVPSLKEECVACLVRDVSFSSACHVLAVGDKHGDQRLLSAARKFILAHFKEVSTSEQWSILMKTNPELLVRTVTYFASNGFFNKDND